ncbi:MAG: DUF1735 domain-containing protein [Nitrosopumilus sp.]|nr:DUF1735 domain-containing protein [Nitrosopumilus sp.]
MFKISFALSTILCLLLASCVKEDNFFSLDSGEPSRTFLKIAEAPQNQLFFEPFSDTRNIQLFSVRRDANSESELNKSVTVSITLDTAAIRAYNTANNETFELLPDSLFTLVGTDWTKTGDLTYQATFAPGEFVKEFTIALDGSKWDISHKYAAPFMINDPGGLTLSSGMDKIDALISVKNEWDGVYEITGTMVDNSNATLTGFYPLNWDLVTSGPNQITAFDKDYTGTPTHIISTAAGLSQYGAYGLIINIDPATNKITSIVNYYGQPSANGRSAELDPSGLNYYDPATKTFYVKYWLLQPSVVASGPRTVFDEVWKFTGPR